VCEGSIKKTYQRKGAITGINSERGVYKRQKQVGSKGRSEKVEKSRAGGVAGLAKTRSLSLEHGEASGGEEHCQKNTTKQGKWEVVGVRSDIL